MGKKVPTDTELAMFLNNATAIDYYDRLMMLATSIFTWKGLDDIAGFGASRFMEQSLFRFGKAAFIKDEELGYMVTNVNPSGKLNNYYLPVRVEAFAPGYSKQYAFDEIVYVMNNELQKPTSSTIALFSNRLYNVERTMDVNLNAQKTPVLIEGDKNALLTLKNLYMQYDGNVPVIYANKTYDISNKLNVLNTQSPYVVDKLEIHKHELWNDCLTFLGINNMNTDKKERLIVSEAESNDDLINYYLNCFYKTRKQACDLINEKYDLNIEIELNKEVIKLLNENKNDIIESEYDRIEEGESDGTLYNNN